MSFSFDNLVFALKLVFPRNGVSQPGSQSSSQAVGGGNQRPGRKQACFQIQYKYKYTIIQIQKHEYSQWESEAWKENTFQIRRHAVKNLFMIAQDVPHLDRAFIQGAGECKFKMFLKKSFHNQ